MKRNQKGSVLVEGVVGLMMVIGSGVAVTLLILNSGTGMLYKTKLAMVTSQAAQFAAAHQSDGDVQGETQSFVQVLMPTVGITPSSLAVKVAQTTLNGAEGEEVTVSNQLDLFGKGVLPDHIMLGDTEFASFCFTAAQ